MRPRVKNMSKTKRPRPINRRIYRKEMPWPLFESDLQLPDAPLCGRNGKGEASAVPRLALRRLAANALLSISISVVDKRNQTI
jgi:hypothetical protein